MAPKSDAERQQARRKRLKEQGRSEVRGIYAPAELHKRIKAYAEKLIRNH